MIEIAARPRGSRGRRSLHVVPLVCVALTRRDFVQVVRRPCLRHACFHVSVPVTRRMPDDGAGSVTRTVTVQRRFAHRARAPEDRGDAPSVVPTTWPETSGGAGVRGVSGDGIWLTGTAAGVTGVEPDCAQAVPPALWAYTTQARPEVSPAVTV